MTVSFMYKKGRRLVNELTMVLVISPVLNGHVS